MAYDNTNKGTIAKNDRKEQDSHPDIAGSINVEGRDFWLNGWLKTNSKDGSKFYSLTVKPKEARSSPPQNHKRDDRPGMSAYATKKDRDDDRTSYGASADDLDSDTIPF